MKTSKLGWVIWLMIAMLGTGGCSYIADALKKDQDKFEEKLDEWRRAELEAREILKDAEETDMNTFEDEYCEALSKMHQAHEEFSDLIKKTEDEKLKKNAKLCSKGMTKVRMALWTYGSYVGLYLERKGSGNPALVKDAKSKKADVFLDYSKALQQGQDLIESSGL